MGSATSCFNSTLYRKTMTRFWPLWALYGVIWAFLIPLNLLNHFFWLQERYQGELDLQAMLTSAALDIPYLLTMGVALSLVFGALAAMASFGYLYNNRSRRHDARAAPAGGRPCSPPSIWPVCPACCCPIWRWLW